MENQQDRLAPWATRTLPDVLERAAQTTLIGRGNIYGSRKADDHQDTAFTTPDANGSKSIIEMMRFGSRLPLLDDRASCVTAYSSSRDDQARAQGGACQILWAIEPDLFRTRIIFGPLQFLRRRLRRDRDELGQWRASPDGRGFCHRISKPMFLTIRLIEQIR